MTRKILKSAQNNQALYIICLMLFLVVAFHLLVSYLQVSYQKEFSQSLLSKAEDISSDLGSSIQEASALSPLECDAQTINKLRIILSKHEFTHDLGLIFNNKVNCSANWGLLADSTPLDSVLYHSPSGYYFASQVANIFPVAAKYDITNKGSVIAFTINAPFKNFDQLNKNFSYKIISKNRKYTFHNYAAHYQFKTDTLLKPQVVETCSTQFQYCIETYNNRPGLLYFPFYISALLIGLIGLISFLIAYSICSYLDKSHSMEFRFRKAIENEELYLEYQPILELKSNKIIGVESLIRWKDSVYGNVSPELFLGIAEQLSLYPTLAYNSVKKALNELSPVLRADSDFSVAININAYEIQTKEYLDYLYDLCTENKIKPQQIKIEITERIELPLDELSCFASKAKTYGFSISLDDFGTGVSNLVWLTEINFDVIKIDKVFTQSISDELKQEMLLAIMSLITNLNRTVIFEGVETVEEFNFIKNYNDDYQVQGQGWYFYKSLPLTELLHVLGQQGGD
ncbi:MULTISPECIES: EAL domain-containing protein [Pseudoalteromonas]|uniref:EAL domain-containing protein n=1 Tax=Pseudoalteromonas TaxID=53246 RepID=UPI000C438CA0|nr:MULTISPECIES: EAL domain-containing protein [Pseudoalteromonas]MAE01983.1 signaling protein [Pseudoalteromonas sp.]QMW16476.1 EAL domain-containing protein [Pseudoalteromonas sp. MT33b]|tara:strand:+ start:2817 stop:4358 length:1542 start_codon:yes stop_codon:yes gene_type:complete